MSAGAVGIAGVDAVGPAGEVVPMPRTSRDELLSVPGVGPSIARDLHDLGVHTIADLRTIDPERLYRALGELRGARIDPCVLYVFRCAAYFADRRRHDPALLQWWNWKDRRYRPKGAA